MKQNKTIEKRSWTKWGIRVGSVCGVLIVGLLIYVFEKSEGTLPPPVQKADSNHSPVQNVQPHEAGFTPNQIEWNHRIYKITNEEIQDVGEKLGDATGANELKSIHREVYRIPGIDPSIEVAVPLPVHTYVVMKATEVGK